jgi:hypothetical protein
LSSINPTIDPRLFNNRNSTRTQTPPHNLPTLMTSQPPHPRQMITNPHTLNPVSYFIGTHNPGQFRCASEFVDQFPVFINLIGCGVIEHNKERGR